MATAERIYPVKNGLTALNLAGTIQQIIQSEGQGKLGIKTDVEQEWSLYFASGRVVWASGGNHRWRRWYRQLRQLRIPPKSIEFSIEGEPVQLEHYILTQLYEQRRITRKSMQFAIDNTVNEVLFDAFLAASSIVEVSCDTEEQEMPESPVTVLGSYDESIARAHASFRAWQVTELGLQSPNCAPQINEEGMRQHGRSIPPTHERFLTVLNGKRSVRDLAVKMQKDLTTLARLLAVYKDQDIITLEQVPDLPEPQLGRTGTVPQTTTRASSSGPSRPGSSAASVGKNRGKTILCVDDSPQICYLMEQMLTEAGYQVICVQEAVEAVATILRQKPALIFLDLVMPVANGYELCKQIRRVSAFREVPIVILTGNDGVIDRVRAKMVGATDFVGKPVKADKILPLVDRYLSGALEATASASEV